MRLKTRQQRQVSEALSLDKQQDKTLLLERLKGLLFLLIVIAFFSWFFIHLSKWITQDASLFPFAQVVVQSDKQENGAKQGEEISKKLVLQAVYQMDLKGFFRQDVREIKNEIQKLPWVQSVSVRKQWPSTLSVNVAEYQAVTKWNQTELLSEDGSVFSADYDVLEDQVLIDLQGPENTSKLVLSTYKELQEQLKPLDLIVVSLILNDRHSWQVQLQDGLLLYLGRKKRAERIARFIKLYPMLQKQEIDNIGSVPFEGLVQKNKKIEYIDLRYDSGVAVGWQNLQSNLSIPHIN